MRVLLLLFLLLPLRGFALPLCPASYVLNSEQTCVQKWELPTGDCPQGNYYDQQKRICLPRCPYHSVEEVSAQGDHVCQKDNDRNWLDAYIHKCAEKNMEYLPQINMCLAHKETLTTEESSQDCPEGSVWQQHDGVMSCVKVDVSAVLADLDARLHDNGLDYMEYLSAMKDIQTNRFAAEVMRYRWEEAQGLHQQVQPQPQPVECPEQYKPNAFGGCKPIKHCGSYSCPDGKSPHLLQDGKNQYCGCQ